MLSGQETAWQEVVPGKGGIASKNTVSDCRTVPMRSSPVSKPHVYGSSDKHNATWVELADCTRNFGRAVLTRSHVRKAFAGNVATKRVGTSTTVGTVDSEWNETYAM